jgi:arylsulfatase
MAGAHGLRQKGPFMYQENVRVPFVVRHPDVRSGFSTEALGSAVDLVPTLLDLAGADAKRVAALYPQLRGVSLAGAVSARDGRTERDRRGVLFNYDTTHYVDSDFAARLVDSGTTANRHMPIAALFAIGQPMPSRHNPALFRGIHDGRHKFARYFKPAEHHVPTDWDTLVGHNQLELYDTQADPDEIVNLAANPDAAKPTLLAMNERLNALVATEVGADLGDEQVGPAFLKRL